MENKEVSIKELPNKINSNQIMKKNEELKQVLEYSIMVSDLVENEARVGIFHKFGKYMRIFGYLVSLTLVAMIFTSCMGGYMATDPSYNYQYQEYARSPQPAYASIWIEGNWNYNNQTHVYVQRAGYWERPRQGQSYVAGSWQTTQHGKSWTKGHWQRDNSQNGNNQRNNRQRDNRDRDNSNR
jgi:hypothetical protein